MKKLASCVESKIIIRTIIINTKFLFHRIILQIQVSRNTLK